MLKKTVYNPFILLFLILAIPLSPYAQNQTPQTESPIYVNQIGYLPSSGKIALVSSPTGLPFEILEKDSQKSIFSGMLKQAEMNDTASGSCLWAADFSALNKAGLFFVRVPGIGTSYPFQIGEHIYNSIAQQSLAAFYFHRSGIPLHKPFAGQWTRDTCHSNDGIIYSATSGAGPVIHNATGGWFDGSDYGKYAVNGNYSAGMLLTLFEYNPSIFQDGSMPIPEQANGIPDLLDEVRWELEFIMRMQNESGAFYHKVTSLEPVNPIFPDKDISKRYVFQPSTAATAGACAVLAKASRLYSPCDATFANQCLQSATHAWQYLLQQPSNLAFENPPNVRTKAFHDSDDSDERFWAAMELFLATRNPDYQNSAIALEQKRIPLLSASGYWGNVMPLAIASIVMATPEIIDNKLRTTALTDLVSLAKILQDKVVTDGFRLSLKEGEYSWGSNGALLQNAFILCLAHIQTKTETFRLAAFDQLHALLGRNPKSICYITGFGSHSPKHPYHLPSMTDNIEAPLPGLIVAGPNQTLGDSALKKTFPAETAPAITYIDSEESISSNDTDLTWNAVLTFVSSYFSY